MEELKDEPFALIGVNSDPLDRAREAVEENGLNWRSFQNQPEGTEKAISDDWKVRGWPTLIVLDADMVIRYRGHSGDEATRVVRELLTTREAPPSGQ